MGCYSRILIDSDINLGLRNRKQEIFINLYRNGRHQFAWSPISFNNGIIFYGDKEEKNFIVNSFENFFQKNINIGESVYFRFPGEKDNGYQSEREYLENFSQFLEDIDTIQDKIQEQEDELHMVEPVGRKSLYIFFDMTDILKTGSFTLEMLQKFQKICTQGYKQLVYVIPFVQNLNTFPENVLKKFDFALFLGKDNMNQSLKLPYKDNSRLTFNPYWQRVGTAQVKTKTSLIYLYPLKRIKSDYAKEFSEYYQEEDKKYDDFLNSLNDGSDI